VHGTRVPTTTTRLGGAAGRGAPHPRSRSTLARTAARGPSAATALTGNATGTARMESPTAARGESGEHDCRDADTAAASDSTAASHRARLRIGVAGRAREVRHGGAEAEGHEQRRCAQTTGVVASDSARSDRGRLLAARAETGGRHPIQPMKVRQVATQRPTGRSHRRLFLRFK
jgi:hypothetical protein